jgi:hypothetical protein
LFLALILCHNVTPIYEPIEEGEEEEKTELDNTEDVDQILDISKEPATFRKTF